MVKKSLKTSSLEPKDQWLWDLELGILHGGCGPYQVCTNDESRLTLLHSMAESILIPKAFIWGNS